MTTVCLVLLLALVAVPGVAQDAPAVAMKPNIILILTDDQGYEDVGVYGASGFRTPNLDRMASKGLRFTSFYATESACSPTRASLMTGSYPTRVGIPEVLFPGATVGLNPDEVTIAELARDHGYATAAIGKWHLGDHPTFLPTNHGFDSYFGIPYSNDMSPDPRHNPWPENRHKHPPLPLVRDTTVVEREPDQSQLTRRYTVEAVEFIQEHRDGPFLLYLAHSMPHVPIFASAAFSGKSDRGAYGDVIEEIDWSVGRIVDTLLDLDIDRNTIVFFSSDNGPWLVFGNHAGSAGPFREGKATTFEGGHRVPAIAWWPGRIAGGRVCDDLATTMDLLPTVAGLVGAKVPTDRVIDGKDIRPILFGDSANVDPYEAFFYYQDGRLEAVRSGNWKLHVPHWYVTADSIGNDALPGVYRRDNMPLALYDLTSDPGERVDVSDRHPDVVDRLGTLIERARAEIGDDLTGSRGSHARPPSQVAAPWGQNPLPPPAKRSGEVPAW
ncbi:MAG TPA: sulfatase [Rhodothermales bacterium]